MTGNPGGGMPNLQRGGSSSSTASAGAGDAQNRSSSGKRKKNQLAEGWEAIGNGKVRDPCGGIWSTIQPKSWKVFSFNNGILIGSVV